MNNIYLLEALLCLVVLAFALAVSLYFRVGKCVCEIRLKMLSDETEKIENIIDCYYSLREKFIGSLSGNEYLAYPPDIADRLRVAHNELKLIWDEQVEKKKKLEDDFQIDNRQIENSIKEETPKILENAPSPYFFDPFGYGRQTNEMILKHQGRIMLISCVFANLCKTLILASEYGDKIDIATRQYYSLLFTPLAEEIAEVREFKNEIVVLNNQYDNFTRDSNGKRISFKRFGLRLELEICYFDKELSLVNELLKPKIEVC